MPASPDRPYDAIVLAGGRATRAGGEKLGLRKDDRTLLDHAVDAVADAVTLIVVGPVVPLAVDREVLWRREDPPYGGPVTAIAAALADLRSAATVVLAGDVPYAGPAVPRLLAALTDDAAVVVDDEGVGQPLLAAYSTRWLRAQVPRAGRAARSLLDGARITHVAAHADDVDTLADAARLGFTRGVTGAEPDRTA